MLFGRKKPILCYSTLRKNKKMNGEKLFGIKQQQVVARQKHLNIDLAITLIDDQLISVNDDQDHLHEMQLKLSSWLLQDGAAALFPEGVDLLAGESDQQAIFLFMLGDVLDDFRDSLCDWKSLDCSFATQLLRHGPKSVKHLDQLFRWG